uniref:histone H1.01-like n=1 Tax=Pristiophorus japonicus TaxID=55135 RepID=UPI00398F5961
MSLYLIKKALAAKGFGVQKRESKLRFSINKNVTNGSLKQINGTGASGSFKSKIQQPRNRAPRRCQRQKKSAKVPAGKKEAAKPPKSCKKATGAKAAKKVGKPRAKATPKSPKTKKAAAKN